MTINTRRTGAVCIAAFTVLSVVITGSAFGVEVNRGGPTTSYDPGIGGPNAVIVHPSKPVVFQGEDDLRFLDENGSEIEPALLVGASGDAEGLPLELPVPRDQPVGQYAIDGRERNAGVTVQTPRIVDLELLNERGVDVAGAAVQTDEVLLVRAEYTFAVAEDLSLEVRDGDGTEVTGTVLADDDRLSQAQLDALVGPYADDPGLVAASGQRGTETRVEYLQGLGQFDESVGQVAPDFDTVFWVLDPSESDAGNYTVTVEGWDDLDVEPASRTSTISVVADSDPLLDLESDEVTRGEDVRYVVQGSPAGATHVVAIEADDFRGERPTAAVFRDVESVIDSGVATETGLAWAVVEVDEDTGLGAGLVDTSYLDTELVDVHLYDTDVPVPEITSDPDSTEDERGLTVEEGRVALRSPAGSYVAGDEVDLVGTATPGVDDVALYARDQGDWQLLDLNEDGQFDDRDIVSVSTDGSWNEDDVELSRASDVFLIPGRFRLGVIDVRDAQRDGELAQTLTTTEFNSGTSNQTTVTVEEPSLGGTFNSTRPLEADGR